MYVPFYLFKNNNIQSVMPLLVKLNLSSEFSNYNFLKSSAQYILILTNLHHFLFRIIYIYIPLIITMNCWCNASVSNMGGRRRPVRESARDQRRADWGHRRHLHPPAPHLLPHLRRLSLPLSIIIQWGVPRRRLESLFSKTWKESYIAGKGVWKSPPW